MSSLRTDFPPTLAAAANTPTVRHEFLEVTTTNEIANEPDYLEELSKYNMMATSHETRTIQEQLNLKLL